MLILASSLIGASACSATYVAYTHQSPEKVKVEEIPTEQTSSKTETDRGDIDPGAAFA